MADNERPKRTPKKTTKTTRSAKTTASSAKTTKKTTARPKTSSAPTRRPATRRPAAADAPDELDPLGRDEDADAAAAGPDEPIRPVAVAGGSAGARAGVGRGDALEDAPPAEDAPEEQDGDALASDPLVPGAPVLPAAAVATDDIEHPMRELGVGVLAALLAASTFLPWYRSGALQVSGWSSGAWGPVVFGLAVAAVAIVVLRRARVAIAFPVHHALVLEAIGWVSVGLILIKRFIAPRIGTAEMAAEGWLTVSLGLALALALLGGSVSQGVSLVVRPGWFSSAAGKLGAGVLALALLVGGVFGFLNGASTGIPTSEGQTTFLEPGYPSCAERIGVPVPSGVEPKEGAPGETGFCIATLASGMTPAEVQAAYVKALKGAGWRILYDSTKAKQAPLPQVQARKGADCASVTASPATMGESGSAITLVIGAPNIACNLAGKIAQQGGSNKNPKKK